MKWLQRLLPHENFIFLGDTARAPYGTRTREELEKLVREDVDWLSTWDIKLLAIGCNTITVMGEEAIKGDHTFPVVGMSKGTGILLEATKNKKIGILATDFTISTGAHKKAIEAADPSVTVYGVGCTKFVPLIEAGKFGSKELADAVNEYADQLKAYGVDTVLLACTHYPFVKEMIEKAMGPDVKVLDPAEETAFMVKKALESDNMAEISGTGRCTVCFTGDVETGQKMAARMLDLSRTAFISAKVGA